MYKTYIETKHENRDIGNKIGWLLIDSPSYVLNQLAFWVQETKGKIDFQDQNDLSYF